MRIDGLSGLRERLQDVADQALEAVREAVKESAEAVRDQTRANVGVNTGHLRDNVAIEYSDGGLRAKVGWFDDRSYYARFQEHGTHRMPARPALHPALENERTRVRGRLAAKLRNIT